MRALLVRDWTTPEGLALVDWPRPEPGPGDLLIRVRAAALSFALSLLIAGRYQRRPALPFIPGNTAAGEIVGGARDGERVVASTGDGALAEYAVASAANVYPIPDSLGFAEATALNTSYNSAAAALTWPHVLGLRGGDTLLVHGAGGGVGSAACEIGRLLGLRVIATASTAAKRAHACTCGAWQAMEPDPPTLKARVLALTDGAGVQGVLDPVGGALFTESLRCLAPEGRICPIGFAGGEIPSVPANLLLVKNIAVTGLTMGHYKIAARAQEAARVQALFARLGRWAAAGLIRPRIAGRVPPERVAEGFALVLDRDQIGHVVVAF